MVYFTLAERKTDSGDRVGGRWGQTSPEAQAVVAETLRLERDNLHLERPRIRKELVRLIKNHVR